MITAHDLIEIRQAMAWWNGEQGPEPARDIGDAGTWLTALLQTLAAIEKRAIQALNRHLDDNRDHLAAILSLCRGEVIALDEGAAARIVGAMSSSGDGDLGGES